MKLDVIICARANSKGIPFKNKRDFNGKTLVHILIEKVNKSKYVKNIFVSSEDQTILDISKDLGAISYGLRPKKLSRDNVRQVDVIKQLISVIESNNYKLSKNLILLQTTSPFIEKKDIESAIKKHLVRKNKALLSVSKEDINPTALYISTKDEIQKLYINNITNQRQKQPKLFLANGAIRIFNLKYFKKYNKLLPNKNLLLYEIPKERSINLDTMKDWDNAINIIKEGKA